MPRVYITSRTGIHLVRALDELGDYAITTTAEGEAVTHKPTGVCVFKLEGVLARWADILHELQSVPSFDLQGFEAHQEAVRAAIRRARSRMSEVST